MGVENVHQSLMLSSFENYRVEYKFDLIHNITSITNPRPHFMYNDSKKESAAPKALIH